MRLHKSRLPSSYEKVSLSVKKKQRSKRATGPFRDVSRHGRRGANPLPTRPQGPFLMADKNAIFSPVVSADLPQFLTAKECADIFRVAVTTFRLRARLGVYPSPVKVGVRSLRWRKSDIMDFLNVGGVCNV